MNAWTPRFLWWCAGPCTAGPPGYLLPRWLFLRALGLIYFSAFYSLRFQIRGLLGPNGLLPARLYLKEVVNFLGASRYWYAPTLLWLDSGDRALLALSWIGMIASLVLVLNIWPRAMLVICFAMFLSFVSAAQDFSGYQSDGMLLAAGFVVHFYRLEGESFFRLYLLAAAGFLVNIALPRVRDFRGVPTRSFDGRGNYTLGVRDHLIFPEIDAGKVDKSKGMNITIVTTAKNDEQARSLLRELGLPFAK